MVVFFIIFTQLLPAIYCLFLLFRIIQFYRRKIQISNILIYTELIITAIFLFYHYYLLPERRLLIYSELISNTTDYGEGIANLAIWAINYLISLGIYLLTQLFFWICLKKDIKRKKNNLQTDIDLIELGNEAKKNKK